MAMNTRLAVRATIGGVPVLLVGDLPKEKGGDAEYAAVVDCRGLDLERFLNNLLSSFGEQPNDPKFEDLKTALRAVHLDTLRVILNSKGKTGWLRAGLAADGFELFLLRKMGDAPNPYAVGMRITKLIRLGDLPWLDQYAAEFPELNHGIQNLGFLYASGSLSYPFPCTNAAPDVQGAGTKFEVVKGGAYAWITQDIMQPEQQLWIPPLKLGEAPSAAEAQTAPDEAAKAIQTASANNDKGTSLADSAANEPEISWIKVNKTLGPFTLARIGGSFANQKFTILLDASVSAAGLTLRLYGLGLSSNISPIKLDFMLSGMGLSFARGPVELSGGLATPDMGKTFFGEVLIRTKGFGLSAIGAYYNKKEYKSLFVFGMLELPLGGPPAFFVTGLAAGFGYHSKLNLPPVSKLNEFVLVKGALPAASGNPLAGKPNTDIMQTLMDSRDSIQPAEGENWLAAGVRFTSFEMIQSFALITVSFGTRCEIALLGRSQMSIPPPLPGATDEPYALAFAEIDLEAVIEPGATGTTPILAVNGVLAAGSYVFAKGCRLTGGFAFYVWASGEFVVTFGGYHPRFSPPPHYPTVGRLGFVWQVSGNLHTQGELYLALTGSGIMAGFAMEAVYQSGPVVASFLARADFLLSWKPFNYDVSISIQIHIALHLNLGLLATNLSYQFGVALQLYGPPFGGVAYVNLGVISFSISFGAETPVPPAPLKWDEFATTFLPPDNSVPASGGSRPPLVQWAGVTGGLIKELSDPVKDDPETSKYVWIVNAAHLEITTHSGIPSTDAVLHQDTRTDKISQGFSKGFGILPMYLDSITSNHSVTINKREAGEWVPYNNDRLVFSFEPVLGNSPNALYGKGDIDHLSTDTMIIDTLLGTKIKPSRKDPEHTLEKPISELLLKDSDPVAYQGFVDPSVVTEHTQSLADNPDLTQKPGADFLGALSQAGCAAAALQPGS